MRIRPYPFNRQPAGELIQYGWRWVQLLGPKPRSSRKILLSLSKEYFIIKRACPDPKSQGLFYSYKPKKPKRARMTVLVKIWTSGWMNWIPIFLGSIHIVDESYKLTKAASKPNSKLICAQANKSRIFAVFAAGFTVFYCFSLFLSFQAWATCGTSYSTYLACHIDYWSLFGVQ